METAKSVLDCLGYLSTLIVLCSAIYAGWLWFRGIAPVLVRLGNGLSRRRIAVFAMGDTLKSFEALLHDCKLFGRSNIIPIASAGDIGKSEEASVFLLNWADYKNHIDEVLRLKKDGTPLIVHAQPREIPEDMMGRLANARNVSVCNFRGRLLNDLVTSMITTSY